MNRLQLMKPVQMSPFDENMSPVYTDFKITSFKQCTDFMSMDAQAEKSSAQLKQSLKLLPESIITMVKKDVASRSAFENASISKYLMKLNFFKMMAQTFSQQTAKQMLRQGKLKIYDQGDLISTCGTPMKAVRILLSGQVGVLQRDQEIQEKEDAWEILRMLVDKVGKDMRQFKNKTLAHKSYDEPQSPPLMKQEPMSFSSFTFLPISKIRPQSLLDVDDLLSYQPKYSQTLTVTVTNTIIFTLSLQQLYESLLLFYNSKQSEVIKMFKKVPIFSPFDNSKIKLLIDKLKIVEKKRGEFIYQEGDESKGLYILTEGEIQISKTIELFKENPNNLYKNRLRMRKQKNDLNIKVLPYADFDGVYNYKHQDKLVTLTVINPVNIFGEEELISSKNRQVNAKVKSLTAKMYQITLANLQQFCGRIASSRTEKKMSLVEFFVLIEECSTMKKILLRQNQLSQMVEHQNKAKYKQLFMNQQQNKRVSTAKAYSSSNSRKESRTSSQKKRQLNEEEAPPTFNNLNFTEYISEDQNYRAVPANSFTREQSKIASMTHSKYFDTSAKKVGKNKDKVIRMRNFSGTKMSLPKSNTDNLTTTDSLGQSSWKHDNKQKSQEKSKITLDEPLFTLKYFKNQQHLEKKLIVVARKKQLQTIYRNSEDLHRVS